MALNILAASVAKLAPRAWQALGVPRVYLSRAVYTKVNGKKEQQSTITLILTIVPGSLVKRVTRSFETVTIIPAMKRNFSESIADRRRDSG
jgi:hypothetical protein